MAPIVLQAGTVVRGGRSPRRTARPAGVRLPRPVGVRGGSATVGWMTTLTVIDVDGVPDVPAGPLAGRRAWEALEPLHNVLYFAPDAQEQFVALGLRGRLMPYFAQRSACLGAAGAHLVAAALYTFNPVTVASSIPAAWELASPADVLAARVRAADRCLRRLLGDAVASPQVAEAAELARRAAQEACRYPQGRPLFAAHAVQDWPDEPHLQLWWAQTLLREFRGDGHVAALLTAGVSGLEALVLFVATEKVDGEALRLTRGWALEPWRGTVEALRAAGLLAAPGPELEVTPRGAELRRWIEARTDLSAWPAYAAIGEAGSLRLAELAELINRPVVAADLIPWLRRRQGPSRRVRSRAVRAVAR
jgi:hypothetical protein